MSADTAGADLERLRAAVRRLEGGVVVAFSGGVDSAVLLKVCVDELGPAVLAATADSASYPAHDRADAARLAAAFGVEHRFVATGEVDDARYRENGPDRCYLCKHELFETLLPIARASGLAHLAFGANAEDADDFRPGHRAAAEFQVKAPLLEAGLSKDAVRGIARRLGIDVWDKPASACLSSRVPFGTLIDPALLRRIEAAETHLRELGFRQCRVRHHGDVARVELEVADLARAAGPLRERIAGRLLALGWLHVALDLVGYRSGSLNAALRAGGRRAGVSESGAGAR